LSELSVRVRDGSADIIGTAAKREFPVDKDILDKIKLKNALSRKVVNTKDPGVEKEYRRVRNQVRKTTCKRRKTFEEELAKKAKVNPKAVWSYIKSKSKSKVDIGDLYTDPGNKD
jgi:hypothetical protein